MGKITSKKKLNNEKDIANNVLSRKCIKTLTISGKKKLVGFKIGRLKNSLLKISINSLSYNPYPVKFFICSLSAIFFKNALQIFKKKHMLILGFPRNDDIFCAKFAQFSRKFFFCELLRYSFAWNAMSFARFCALFFAQFAQNR